MHTTQPFYASICKEEVENHNRPGGCLNRRGYDKNLGEKFLARFFGYQQLALLDEFFCYLVIIVVDYSLLQFVIISWLIRYAVNLIIVSLPNCLTKRRSSMHSVLHYILIFVCPGTLMHQPCKKHQGNRGWLWQLSHQPCALRPNVRYATNNVQIPNSFLELAKRLKSL